MNKEAFLNKWGWQSAQSIQPATALFDCRKELEKDLNEIIDTAFKAGEKSVMNKIFTDPK